MPRYPIKQPNGKYAIYSTIVDHFVSYDMTREEAIAEQNEREPKFGAYPGGLEALKRDILKEFDNLDRDGKAWNWAKNWDEAIAWIKEYHGEDDETLKEAISLGNNL